jgi:hypothetical protein
MEEEEEEEGISVQHQPEHVDTIFSHPSRLPCPSREAVPNIVDLCQAAIILRLDPVSESRQRY